MDKIVIIYDDSLKISDEIKMIVGKSSYGKIRPKRKNNFEQFEEMFDNIDKVETKVVNIKLKNKEKELKYSGLLYFYTFSNYVVKDKCEFQKMLKFILNKRKNCCIIQDENIVAVVTKDIQCINNLLKLKKMLNLDDNAFSNYEMINVDNFLDISKYNNLLTYISGKLDARYFNSLEVSEDVVIKKSTNKDKIKREYMYYQLLPDEMKKWVVEPYDYKEKEKTAQYSMERIHATDVAIKWTHNAIDEKEFVKILDKLFLYINIREKKEVTEEQYKTIEQELYINKLKQRIEELKKHKMYNKIEMHIKSGTQYGSIEKIYEYYVKMYKKYNDRSKKYISVIGHGDLCFSNIIYDEKNYDLKLVDPRGALKKEEMWTNPYYDVAKLSHSICGNYDFFNHNRYDIILDNNLKYKLKVYNDNSKYKKIFKKYLKINEFDYELVRIYEASLFLSMLPLHMDYPQKVFGFLLNAIDILKEVEGGEV